MARGADPADTRMMGIVHAALTRDLHRVRVTVAAKPSPVGEQRRALGAHVVWMMDFLHTHHVSEDSGLWPLVRERDPSAAALLDSLEADHQQIDPLASALKAAGQRYEVKQGDEEVLVDALDALLTVLVPHLDREVAEAMPVVSQAITHAEWHEIELTYTIKPKSLPQLAMEAQWVLDGIDAQGRDVVVHTVPLPMRWLVLKGFAGRYRRASHARWTSITPAVIA